MKIKLLSVAVILFGIALLVRPFPTVVMIFPRDFTGRAVAVEDPSSDFRIPINGWWHREAMIRFPESGILKVADMTPFHWLTKQKILLDDGTIIDGTHPWTKRPSRFRFVEVPDEHSIGRKVAGSGQVDYVEFELADTPRFDSIKLRERR